MPTDKPAVPVSDNQPTPGPPDTAAYPALALLLVFTTSPQWLDPNQFSDDFITKNLGINDPHGDIVSGLRIAANSDQWRQVRTDFQNIVASGPAYQGPQCPATFETFTKIATLLAQRAQKVA